MVRAAVLGMRTAAALLAGFTGLVLALGPGAAMDPPAAHARACDNIRFDGRDYVFYKQDVRCRRAKKLLRHVRRTRGDWQPRRWDCGSGSNWTTGGGCSKRGNPRKLFGFHPYD